MENTLPNNFPPEKNIKKIIRVGGRGGGQKLYPAICYSI